jgi:UV DNA damage repair endonuclease
LTNQNIKRIGFCCKFSEFDSKKGVVSVPNLNTGGTTITWLNNQKREIAEQKLWDTLQQNITHTYNLVKKVGSLDPELRMVRLTSDMLTAYTHDNWSYFYKRPDVIARIEQLFAGVGNLAREKDVRLSFHPGQFCVLASASEAIVNKSIEEFEYHADMARYMGYGKKFQDFKINVHISGKAGPEGIRNAYKRLTPEARSCITIENEENAWGLDDCISITDLVPIVLDVHHHWVKTGEYISALDPRIDRIVQSWRGVRPAMHYSISREDYLVDHNTSLMPNYQQLLEDGFKKQKLRAHSDFMWSTAVNDWVHAHWAWTDIQVEAKAKNLASFKLHEQWKKNEIL